MMRAQTVAIATERIALARQTLGSGRLASRLPKDSIDRLAAVEIAAAIGPAGTVFIPEEDCSWVEFACSSLSDVTIVGWQEDVPKCDVLYLGPEAPREVVDALCKRAQELGYQRIVSLVSSSIGDYADRLEDMGGGKLACLKVFEDFALWVLVLEVSK